MALSRLYYTRAEVALDDETSAVLLYQSFMYAIFSLLCGVKLGGTTGTSGAPPAGVLSAIDHMCDGTTAGTPGDGVDRWSTGAAFDATKLVRSASGATAKSWAVGVLPSTVTPLGVPFYWVLGLQGGANGGIYWALSKTQPTGGTVNVIPTAADSVIAWNSSQVFADLNFAPSVHKVSIVFSEDGHFYIGVDRVGQGLGHTLLGVWDFTGSEASGDLFPLGVFCNFNSTSPGAGIESGPMLSVTGWTTAASAQGSGVGTRGRDNATAIGSADGSAVIGPRNSTWFTRTHLNPSGKLEALECKYLFANTALAQSYVKGTLPDWWLANASKAVGIVDPPTGASELIRLGHFFLPNGGAARTM